MSFGDSFSFSWGMFIRISPDSLATTGSGWARAGPATCSDTGWVEIEGLKIKSGLPELELELDDCG